MSIGIVGRRIDLTDGIKEHIENSIKTLDKFHLDILNTKIILSDAEKHGKKGFDIEFIISLAGRDSIVIKQHEKDMYAGIDLAIERAKKVLGRHHEKIKNHKFSKNIDIPDIMLEDNEDEIVPATLDIDKPVTIEEALQQFKSTNAIFIIFKDIDDNTRVMYRRKDGKVGLY
jgi:putative sigma-54 modulation protein